MGLVLAIFLITQSFVGVGDFAENSGDLVTNNGFLPDIPMWEAFVFKDFVVRRQEHWRKCFAETAVYKRDLVSKTKAEESMVPSGGRGMAAVSLGKAMHLPFLLPRAAAFAHTGGWRDCSWAREKTKDKW